MNFVDFGIQPCTALPSLGVGGWGLGVPYPLPLKKFPVGFRKLEIENPEMMRKSIEATMGAHQWGLNAKLDVGNRQVERADERLLGTSQEVSEVSLL